MPIFVKQTFRFHKTSVATLENTNENVLFHFSLKRTIKNNRSDEIPRNLRCVEESQNQLL